jgi:DNA modification methylase
VILSELKVTVLPIDKIIPYINNSRTHSTEQIARIAASIKEFGFNDPIALDALNGVIAGHGRLEAAKLLGINLVPTIQLGHLTREQQKAYVLAHNRIALDAGWDNELLRIELQELKDAGFDISKTGFEDKEIEELLNPEIVNEGLSNDDAIPSIEVIPVVLRGDTWILGSHRLRCGDSTNEGDVAELMDGLKPNLMVTDPPYGVEYKPEWREQAGKRIGETSCGKVENDDRVDWTDAYSLFGGDIVYVWHAGLYAGEVATHLGNCGFGLISQIVWVKQHFALSRGDYHWQHEPCWYAVRKGKKHNWQGARDQATTWDIMNNNAFGNANPEKTWGHGTQKPIECMARPIINNSSASDYVYDPFGGSGTTLIACEKHNRKCLMMEVSPLYCDVIIKRWQDFTGKKAILEANGLSFEDISNGRTTIKGSTLQA